MVCLMIGLLFDRILRCMTIIGHFIGCFIILRTEPFIFKYLISFINYDRWAFLEIVGLGLFLGFFY